MIICRGFIHAYLSAHGAGRRVWTCPTPPALDWHAASSTVRVFPIALLKPLRQWVWHRGGSSVGVYSLWEDRGRLRRKCLSSCNIIEKEEGRGYCSHLQILLCWYCTYQSIFTGHVRCIHWHSCWLIIVIMLARRVYKYTAGEGTRVRRRLRGMI